MRTFDVEVTLRVRVTLDETKFTPEFHAGYKAHFNQFNTVEDHVAYLARLYVQGTIDNHEFIEGYGEADEFGINLNVSACFESEPQDVEFDG